MEYAVISPDAATEPDLRAGLLDTWVAATDTGGSVGFVAPAPVDLVAATLDAALARVAEGQDLLGVLRHEAQYVGMGLLVAGPSRLTAHWRTVLRVMVHPKHQGGGSGRLLMGGLRSSAEELGLEHLMLTVRDGSRLDEFYGRLGYRVVGRHPRAVRVAADDYRDELMLVTDLGPTGGR